MLREIGIDKTGISTWLVSGKLCYKDAEQRGVI